MLKTIDSTKKHKTPSFFFFLLLFILIAENIFLFRKSLNNFLIHCFQVSQTTLNIPTLENCDLNTEYVVTFTPTIPVRSYRNRYPEITFYAPDEVNVKESCTASLMDLKPVHVTFTAACKQDPTTGLKPIIPVFLKTTPVWHPKKYSLPKLWVRLIIKLSKQLFAICY